ncbi:hypothetical protein BGP77_01745 [Saccharospirillum sp. MSK14-1]|uniref:hypothetical protein n=1 Tax=Saccharospirillum sp. MSK14-1 TaxID=1897632 RepID=UPI000D48243A|nr:hypothetical protein [Saccharospirillum sp. MSK14-1]PTY36067.1 hypothetical protein BGP77_01745 [Saccharospirillum sp. MSK14-1]
MKMTAVQVAVACLVSIAAIGGAQAADWTAQPTYGSVNLSAGFLPDPHVVSLTAGGEYAASEAHQSCSGYISNAPDVDLNYDAGSHSLALYVDSQADTTLVVYDADGNWHCSDDFASDTAGTNPGIVLSNPSSGNYNIWIGTYEVGEFPPAQLKISETQPVWEASTGDVQSASDIEWGDNTSPWANDGECDDPRFAGPGAASMNNVSDRFHDADDCRSLYQSGEIYLR